MQQPEKSDEATVMAKLRADAKTSPASALALADDAEARFGDSASTEERRAIAVQALIDLGRIGEARSRATQFLAKYPNSPYAPRVEVMTGVHVTPTGSKEGP